MPDDSPRANPTDLLLDVVRALYPHPRLDAAALEEVRSDLERQLARSKILSDPRLTNGDGVWPPFRPYVPDEG